MLRGDGDHPATAGRSPQTTGMRSELVAFADPSFRPVTVLRGQAMVDVLAVPSELTR